MLLEQTEILIATLRSQLAAQGLTTQSINVFKVLHHTALMKIV